MPKSPAKNSLNFAVFGLSFALCLTDEIKRLVPMKSHQYNRVEAADKTINLLLDSVAQHGPQTIDCEKAEELFNLLKAKVLEMYSVPKPRQTGIITVPAADVLAQENEKLRTLLSEVKTFIPHGSDAASCFGCEIEERINLAIGARI
ncbi:MAG: hypothetical protein AB9919_06810 [Geobacteraceae bacterium]